MQELLKMLSIFRINFSYALGKATQPDSKRVKRLSNDDLKEGGSDNNDGGENR